MNRQPAPPEPSMELVHFPEGTVEGPVLPFMAVFDFVRVNRVNEHEVRRHYTATREEAIGWLHAQYDDYRAEWVAKQQTSEKITPAYWGDISQATPVLRPPHPGHKPGCRCLGGRGA